MTQKNNLLNSGTALRKLRNMAGLTQIIVADKIICNRGTFSRMESGLQKLTILDVFTIAEFYKIKPSELVHLIELPLEEMNQYILSLGVSEKEPA